MTQPTLRFLHASDLHLERPLSGLAEVPESLLESFLEAPYQAAQQVFETALSENVDAVLLAGDIVDFSLAGPRAVVFLTEQFQRLKSHNIRVFWACGDMDPADSWPASIPLPENVHIFPVGQVETIELVRQGETVAAIQGISRRKGAELDDRGFHRDVHGLFTLAVAYNSAAAPGEEGDRVHYMALGGRHQRQTVDHSPGIAHYSGTPQGRSPEETGPCGCTLVTVDETGHVNTSFVATDVLRWVTEVVEVTAGTDEDALLAQLEARIAKLRTKHYGSELLVTWRIEGRGQVLNHIRTGGISDDMVELLRQQQGQQSPRVWTVAMESDSPLDVPQEWVDEETIMGDLLREFRALEADPDLELGLEEFLPCSMQQGHWLKLAEVKPKDRASLLWAASKMGVDLLDGDEQITAQ